jgi:spore coat protein U-like protein
VDVTCSWSGAESTQTPNVKVCVNLGNGDATTSSQPRSLVNGTNLLRYNLYQKGRGFVWGAVANRLAPLSFTLSTHTPGNSTASYRAEFYGRIVARQFTVPTVDHANTLYTENFNGNDAVANYYPYSALAAEPSCSAIPVMQSHFHLAVNATVVNACTITAGNVDFEETISLSKPLLAEGKILVTCTSGSAYTLALSAGSSGNVLARLMKGAGGKVKYQLYRNSPRTIVWGDGTGGSVAQGTGNGNSQKYSVYGLVPSQTAPNPGRYQDIITATIRF